MMKIFKRFIFFAYLLVIVQTGYTQQIVNSDKGIYVDKEGVIRYKKDHKEASFFGVNYTAPFAYAYRAHKALHADIEKAIQQDVYHLSRLGLDAFRVHVWDTEISDSSGNLLENEHLRLFDFLVTELKKRNIRIIITPIAFWGNGYPERDEKTAGFSSVYNKEQATSDESAIKAQERYVKQFFKHVNPYTGLTYRDDPDIIAAEINNEPSHSGPGSKVTAYINRLAAAIRSTGWSKPLFYNISQSPYYAGDVAAANVNGFSFQWYPSGLVANHEQKGNFLPNIDRYTIPYDTIPGFRNKARMVYEFDAADMLQSNMYPAMVRSFREAGFQWATQFAYDPMALAYANTEYQTHYLNLAYTPSKAISLLIASKAFHRLPRLKSYGIYPADSVFGAFRVSYKESLSEMNTAEEFYYSNPTSSQPVNRKKLEHIAGVGSSAVIHYGGSGAYFLDKLEDGVWRLEVMPDAIHIRDPFEKASPEKEVTRIQWQEELIKIMLPDLGSEFTVKGLNEGNTYSSVSGVKGFRIQPGAYLLVREGKQQKRWNAASTYGVIRLGEFAAPQPFNNDPYVSHQPYFEVSCDKSFTIRAKIAGIDTADKVSVLISKLAGRYDQFRNLTMVRQGSGDYTAEVPAEIVTPGVLNYRIMVHKANGEYFTFPGKYKGNPFAWDYYHDETWNTFVASGDESLELFNAANDRNINSYPVFRRNFERSFITAEKPGQLVLRLAADKLPAGDVMGFQYFFADKIAGRQSELSSFGRLVIRARTAGRGPVSAKVSLITADASAFASDVTLSHEFRDISIPLKNLKPASFLLLPRPYPGFLPMWFKPSAFSSFNLSDAERLEVTLGSELKPSEPDKPYRIEIEWVRLERSE